MRAGTLLSKLSQIFYKCCEKQSKAAAGAREAESREREEGMTKRGTNERNLLLLDFVLRQVIRVRFYSVYKISKGA